MFHLNFVVDSVCFLETKFDIRKFIYSVCVFHALVWKRVLLSTETHNNWLSTIHFTFNKITNNCCSVLLLCSAALCVYVLHTYCIYSIYITLRLYRIRCAWLLLLLRLGYILPLLLMPPPWTNKKEHTKKNSKRRIKRRSSKNNNNTYTKQTT